MTSDTSFASITAPRAHDAPFVPRRSTLAWLCEREILRFLKMWHMTVAGQVVASVLFVLVFGIALGDRISSYDGVPYKRYIVPGLLIQAIVTVAYINGTASLFMARHEHYFNDVLASPLRWWELTIGLVSGGIVRGALTGGGVLAVCVPLTGIGVQRPLVLVLATVGVLIAASQVGVLAGAYASSFDQTHAANTLLLLPLTFVAGAFYSVRELPSVWEAISHLNPVYYAVQSYQIGFLGEGEVSPVIALVVLYTAAAALSVWSGLIFRTGRRIKA
ncbi:MAG TPA: ABC transporter permease [Baekduia sp.]|nr:ABC transporter permease [Baekduia sp.]